MEIIKESRTSGLVGIWWYTDTGDIWAFTKDIDHGYNDGNYIQYSGTENHSILWKKVVRQNVSNNPDFTYSKGYKSLERGRVIYNLRTQCYEVTGSKEQLADREFREKCVDYFNLNNCRYDFVPLSHYYKAEITGNPSVDEFNYGF